MKFSAEPVGIKNTGKIKCPRYESIRSCYREPEDLVLYTVPDMIYSTRQRYGKYGGGTCLLLFTLLSVTAAQQRETIGQLLRRVYYLWLLILI